jgi:hypothetical protein
MLEQKWEGRQRGGERWQQSLNLRWAVIKFAEDKMTIEQRGKPKIDRLPDREEPKKSVNELLPEMRMTEKAPAAATTSRA